MVSIGVSKMGMTELVFVVPGMKVNGQYYPAEGFPWADLREIFSEYQWMAKVPNAVEILPKI